MPGLYFLSLLASLLNAQRVEEATLSLSGHIVSFEVLPSLLCPLSVTPLLTLLSRSRLPFPSAEVSSAFEVDSFFFFLSLVFFFFNFYTLFIYLFIFGCVGSSFLCVGFLYLRRVGATLHHSARASHGCGLSCCSLSCCGAQAPNVQAQYLWLTGLVAPQHVGSSQTRARTRVPCTGRQILNHCATREAPR